MRDGEELCDQESVIADYNEIIEGAEVLVWEENGVEVDDVHFRVDFKDFDALASERIGMVDGVEFVPSNVDAVNVEGNV